MNGILSLQSSTFLPHKTPTEEKQTQKQRRGRPRAAHPWINLHLKPQGTKKQRCSWQVPSCTCGSNVISFFPPLPLQMARRQPCPPLPSILLPDASGNPATTTQKGKQQSPDPERQHAGWLLLALLYSCGTRHARPPADCAYKLTTTICFLVTRTEEAGSPTTPLG